MMLLGLHLPSGQAKKVTCNLPPRLTDQDDDGIQANERNRCLAGTIAKRPDYNMLVFSWSPNYCTSQKVGASYKDEAKFQCETNKFGWVVHGLWGQLQSRERLGR